MLHIPCPWCRERPETEFVCGGEAKGVRPEAPELMSDDAWIEYLCGRENPRGRIKEMWWHAKGCGLWFPLWRDTASHEILALPEDNAS